MTHHQPYSLADVLCEAPPLLALLSSQDCKALSACGKELRHLIHSSVTAITTTEVSDAERVLTGSWPQLALIKIQSTARLTMCQHGHLTEGSNFPQIASIYSTKNYRSITALLVRPNPEVDQQKSIAAAFRHLHASEWRETDILRIVINVYACGEEVVAQIAQLAWPCVTNLCIHSSMLGYTHVKRLTEAAWPRLKILD